MIDPRSRYNVTSPKCEVKTNLNFTLLETVISNFRIYKNYMGHLNLRFRVPSPGPGNKYIFLVDLG